MKNFDPPSDKTGDGPQTSVWTISNHTFFNSLAAFVKPTRFILLITYLLQGLISTDFRSSKTSFTTRNFILLALISPSLLCHRLEFETLSTIAIMFIQPAVVYKVSDFEPRATTIAPFTIFYELFPNSTA